MTVGERDGYVVLSHAGGESIVSNAGGPIRLMPDWGVAGLVAQTAEVKAVLLSNRGNGQKAIWYVDPTGLFLANDAANLPAAQAQALAATTVARAQAAWRSLFCGEAGGDGTPVAWHEENLSAFATLTPQALTGGPVAAEVFRPGVTTLSIGGTDIAEERLAAFFAAPQLEAALDALRHGTIAFPSLAGEGLTRTDKALHLGAVTQGYILPEPGLGTNVIAVVALWKAMVVALYVPAQNRLILAAERARRQLVEWRGSDDDFIARHFLTHADQIAACFARPSRRPALAYTQPHLGHHLWNELSGISRVAEEIPPSAMPTLLINGDGKSEMFGRIDDLFPSLAGHVVRGPVASGPRIPLHAYEQGWFLLRPSDDFVSASLRGAICRHALASPAVLADIAQRDALRAHGARVVMIGLRVENRTLSNLQEFCLELIATIRDATDRPVAIVFDGHNGDDEKDFVSHGEHRAAMPPAEVERTIVQAARDAFADDPRVTIVSTIGRPVAASLVWCLESEFFVTPWGAGLAKYRWACNRPGLVLCSHTFRRTWNLDPLHLYDAPRYMTDPTPMTFTMAADATDDPDGTPLVDLSDPGRVNFRVDHAQVFAQVRGFMAMRGD